MGIRARGSSDGKESSRNVGDPVLIPGLGRSPGEGNGYPLPYSFLENSMDGEPDELERRDSGMEGILRSLTT